MRIAMIGTGYVGLVSGTCFSEFGIDVVCVDKDAAKIEKLHQNIMPIYEPGLDDLVADNVKAGRLSFTTDLKAAVKDADAVFIAVGTPSRRGDGHADLSYVYAAAEEIADAMTGYTVIVTKSTVPVGTGDEVESIIKKRRPDAEFDVVSNPEFLREGSSVKDFHNPPQTVIGSLDEAGYVAMEKMYSGLPGIFVRTSCEVAESVKYLCNVFHALKIVFANEAGSVLKGCGLDGREVMKIFCQDTQLNISPVYLRPGFAFGGSCLPKEVKGFLTLAREKEVPIPVLSELLNSNEAHIEQAYNMIARDGHKKVALFGLAFKPGTDDMRDSPLVVLAERLLGKGFGLSIYDNFVVVSRLMGKNKEFIEREIPHLDRLLAETPEAALDGAEVIVIGHADAYARQCIVAAASGRRIVDLSGYADIRNAPAAEYEGICW